MRIAGAVPSFVMVIRNDEGFVKLTDGREHIIGILRMLVHHLPFLRRQPPYQLDRYAAAVIQHAPGIVYPLPDLRAVDLERRPSPGKQCQRPDPVFFGRSDKIIFLDTALKLIKLIKK